MDFDYRPFLKAANTKTTVTLVEGDVAAVVPPTQVNSFGRNSKITIAASASANFQGQIDLYYNRISINLLPTVELKVPMSSTDFDVKLNLITKWYESSYTILPDDLEIASKTNIAYRKYNYVFKAHPFSISFMGQKTATVKFNYSQSEITSTSRIDIDRWETYIAIPD